MKLTTFIKRPILSGVISVLIVLLGVVGFMSLPVEQYPDIAPPTVEVTAYYYGADAQAIINSVINPIEDQINGVEHMMYMSSKAYNSGQATISVVFRQGTDADIAAVNVQNRVKQAESLLPAEVLQAGIIVEKRQNSMLQVISVCSPDDTYDFDFLCNFAELQIKPDVMRVNGVGKYEMIGNPYSMRIWLDPAKMLQHSINPSEVSAALQAQNLEAATGTLGQDSDESYQYTMKYTGRLKTEEEFENIVIRSNQDGTILRLKDIATIELGIKSYVFNGMTNGHPGVMAIIYQATGSNATQVNNEIDKVLDKVRATAPSGVEIVSIMNTNDFLYASIDQVAGTLRDAIILVILIVLLFLKDWRSTIIPFIAIMVSLIGTFAFMMTVGFSVNMLTLFALVLVIGTVVDDSIVVVEAVHTNFDRGITDPYLATKGAIKEIALPVITSSLVFMAVFLPVSFLGGTSGVFYRQFGLTMAVAVGISALNALTTVPALCSIMLKPIPKPVPGQKMTFQQKYAVWFDGFFEKFSNGYKGFLAKIINKKSIIGIAIAIGAAVLVFCLMRMPAGLVPNEDKAFVIVEISLPAGTSLSATTEVASRMADEIKLMEGVQEVAVSNGYGFVSGQNASASVVLIRLNHWDDRDKETTQEKIQQRIMTEVCSKYKEANCVAFSTPMIPGYGTTTDIEMYVQDRTGAGVTELFQVTREFLGHLKERGLFGFTVFNMDYPQWEVKVDAAKCMRSGLTPKDVLSAMGTYYGGSYISNMNLYGKVYWVYLQCPPEDRRDELTLENMYVKTADGKMAPLSSFVSLRKVYGPDAISNFNLLTSIQVNVSSNMSDAEALLAIHEVEKQYLPEGYSLDFGGMAREQDEQGGLGLILGICIFLIFLILAALYESLVIPFAVLLAVPIGLAGSYLASMIAGVDNNIYLQTGVIMLIGLLSKTAILITEYSVQRHEEQGMDITTAALEAAEARLRPIIMTVMTMVIGLFPLVASVNGVGGKGNFSLGLGTIVGMTIGTIGLLFITPAMYTTFQKIQDKMKSNKNRKDDDED